MSLREKRKSELESQKSKRKDEVIAAALELFMKNGIENTKMTDIAEKAEIGVASAYRYFRTKPDIVVEAACKLWKDEIGEQNAYYNSKEFAAKDGITKVNEILDVFIKLYSEHQDFLRFLDEFDRYVIRENIPSGSLNLYEKSIIDLETVLLVALQEGKDDGTIRSDVQGDLFYFTVTHALMSLSQKLILRGNVLESDGLVDSRAQLETMIKMAVNYIQA
ncbi:MAG: TetR/AcrR family transcriptional regulator [Clostridiales bacterium]|nr:TetR/AcrR family transcriptional regulator [Clostridiales bacterium]